MRYLSVCSGIEAASVAWHPLGWTPVGFSEIEPFPSAVLAHHYPKVKNYGDMSKFRDWSIRSGDIDLLVGGTPCQSFSIAGLRQGLKDPRGNLMLTFLAIAEHLKPKWIVWENVPGVLSSNGGKDFGSFLGGLGELGYGFAYRILDAQWCRTHGHPRAVPQRRRRVFVVGCARDHIGPAKVLFEQESMLRYSATRGSSRQGTSADVAGCLKSGGDGGVQSSRGEHLVFDESKPMYCGSDINASDTVTSKWQKQSGGPAGSECGLFVLQPVTAILFENHPNDSRITGPHNVAPSCVSRYGTGGGNVPLVIPIQDSRVIEKNQNGLGVGKDVDPCPTVLQPYNIVFNDSNGKRKDRLNGGLYINKTEVSTSLTQAESDTKILTNVHAGAQAVAIQGTVIGRQDHNGPNSSGCSDGGEMFTLTSMDVHAVAYSFDSLASNSMKSSNPVSGCNMVDVAKCIDTSNPCPSKNQGGIAVAVVGQVDWRTTNNDAGQVSQTLKTDLAHQSGPCLAVTAPTLTATNDPSRSPQSSEITQQVAAVHSATMQVRRLTPTECERLQGFPDGWTAIPWKKKLADDCPDGPRYKALGNSMAVNCMEWLGKRIQKFDQSSLCQLP